MAKLLKYGVTYTQVNSLLDDVSSQIARVHYLIINSIYYLFFRMWILRLLALV